MPATSQLPTVTSSCCAPSCCSSDAAAPKSSATVAADARFTLRPATKADLPAALALIAAAGLPSSDVASAWGPGFAVALAESGDLVGVEGIEVHGDGPRYGLLRSAAVAPEWRGHGVGEALTRDRLAWAREQGLAEVWLLTSTAAHWFPRFGFEPAERNAAPAPLLASSEFTTTCTTGAAMRWVPGESEGAELRAAVRARYGAAATSAAAGQNAAGSCCDGAGKVGTWNPITSDLYTEGEAQGVPAQALLASLGCGNPTALAELRPGETVLDLGSGGGIDVLLSAKRVGPTGKAYGLDMTDEMLALAERNRREAGAENVEFLKGEIEKIPLPDASVDVIISNCVINLAADKGRVLREAFRVLKPGGRFAVSDVVARGEVPPAVRRSMELWMGCVAGALEERVYRDLLTGAGFEQAEVEPTRIYRAEDASAVFAGMGLDPQAVEEVDGKFMSAFVRATKPVA